MMIPYYQGGAQAQDGMYDVKQRCNYDKDGDILNRMKVGSIYSHDHQHRC